MLNDNINEVMNIIEKSDLNASEFMDKLNSIYNVNKKSSDIAIDYDSYYDSFIE